jgi:integrase
MSVYKKPGYPHYYFDFQISGKRFHGSTEAGNQKDAEAAEKRLKLKARADIEAQRQTGNAPMSLDMAAERYWNEVGQGHKDAAATWTNLRRIIGFIGKDKRLDAITDADVAALVAWRRNQAVKGQTRKVAPATVNRSAIEPLRKILNRARKVWHVALPREPNWIAHRLKEPPGIVRELHASEEASLTDAMRSDYAPWIKFALLTGLRRAETLITWDNVNWHAKTITTVGKAGRLVSTPITPAVAALLEPLNGHHPEAVFTFVRQRGAGRGKRCPITYHGGNMEWRRLMKRAGVKDFRFHDLRHTTATRLLRETGNLALVQRALNHADVTTTARYAHVNDAELSVALQRVAQKGSVSPDKSPDATVAQDAKLLNIQA